MNEKQPQMFRSLHFVLDTQHDSAVLSFVLSKVPLGTWGARRVLLPWLLRPLVRFGPLPLLRQRRCALLEHQGVQDIMTTKIPIPKVTQRLTDPEGAAIRRQDAEPIEDPVLTDAEEEEMAELWAADRGNQGA